MKDSNQQKSSLNEEKTVSGGMVKTSSMSSSQKIVNGKEVERT